MKNLVQAFTDESQTRNRYTFATGIVRREKLPVIQVVSLFTADQEKGYAEVFYNYMKELVGEAIYIDGSHSADVSQSTIDPLKAARHNEVGEYGVVYKASGDTAEEEGFTLIGDAFRRIAEIEKIHAGRFNLFTELMEKNQLLALEAETDWTCLNCGYVYQETKAPAICLVRKHEQGHFIRLGLAPYVE